MKIRDTLIASFLLCSLGFGACSNENPAETDFVSGDEIQFVATLTPTVTVATTRGTVSPLTNAVGDVTVIAPGYANSGATWQKAAYTVTDNPAGALTIKVGEESKTIKRTAVKMPIAAWTTPAAITSNTDGLSGTVDFTNTKLENFVGAVTEATLGAGNKLTAVLPFSHLVGKLTLTVVDNADQDVTLQSSITFSSVKKVGTFSASLTKLPEVKNGQSGEVLTKALNADPIYLPPLENFAENGTFTLTVGDGSGSSIDYPGTLNNLKDNTGKSIERIAGGQHIMLTIKVLDDHSLEFIGITLAPWNESEKEEVNNRPCPGIWGGQDLIDFAEGYNEGKAMDENFIKKYITQDEKSGMQFVRLYTDIEVGADFTAIGTKDIPFGGTINDTFKGITFDGNGFIISGLKISATVADNQGLFGYTTNATLRDIRLAGAIIKGRDNVGVLVGTAEEATTIDNCRITKSSASGSSQIGGLAGNVASGVSITNCSVDEGSVSATGANAGGIAGVSIGNIQNCYAILSNGLDGSNAGGLVGCLEAGATLRNGYASPFFTNGTNVETHGALIGKLIPEATATNLYWDRVCVDKTKCNSAVGGTEVIPDNSQPFNIVSGRLVNSANNKDTKAYLFDCLNGYIQGLSGDEGNKYKRWAIIGTSRLPILRP